MKQPKVAVVILNWNGMQDTLECLDSVLAMDYSNFDVVVVDNGSSDDSVQAVRAKFPWVTLIETGANLGYAGGNNVGIRHAIDKGAQHVLLLNNDTVADPALVTELVRATETLGDDSILAAQIYLHASPERLWYAGARVDETTATTRHERTPHAARAGLGLVETDYASGCVFFVSARLLSRIGVFDERFFLMYEETDLCYRARAVGAKCFVVPGAKVWHKVSVSFGGVRSPGRAYFLSRNKLLWAEKHLPLRRLLRVYGHMAYELLYSLRPPRFRPNSAGSGRPAGSLASAQEYGAALIAHYRSPILRARVQGVRDYILRRFGNRPGAKA